jgi:hypothetical protein
MIFFAGSIIRIKKAGAHPSLDREVARFGSHPAQRRTPPEPVKCIGQTIGVRDENIDVEVCSHLQKSGAEPHGGTPRRPIGEGMLGDVSDPSLSEACPGRRPASARRWLRNAELLGPGTSMHCDCLSMLPPLVIRCIRPRDLLSVNGLLALSETPVTCPRLSDLFRGEHPAGSVLPACFLSISVQLVRKSGTAGRK